MLLIFHCTQLIKITHLSSFRLPFTSPQSKMEGEDGGLTPQNAHGFLGVQENITVVSDYIVFVLLATNSDVSAKFILTSHPSLCLLPNLRARWKREMAALSLKSSMACWDSKRAALGNRLPRQSLNKYPIHRKRRGSSPRLSSAIQQSPSPLHHPKTLQVFLQQWRRSFHMSKFREK